MRPLITLTYRSANGEFTPEGEKTPFVARHGFGQHKFGLNSGCIFAFPRGEHTPGVIQYSERFDFVLRSSGSRSKRNT